MKTYITATFQKFSDMLTFEGIELYDDAGELHKFTCIDYACGQSGLAALGAPMPSPLGYFGPVYSGAPGCYDGAFGHMHRMSPLHTGQKECEFVCELSKHGDRWSVNVSTDSHVFAANAVGMVVPVRAYFQLKSLSSVADNPIKYSPFTVEYAGSVQHFLASAYHGQVRIQSAPTVGAALVDTAVFHLYRKESTMRALGAIDTCCTAIRMMNGHDLTYTQSPVSISKTQSPPDIVIVCEWNGHNNLAVSFKDHPTFYVNLHARRVA